MNKSTDSRASKGQGAAIALPTIAARATAIREVDENFMMNTFGESCRNQRWTSVWDSETSSECCNIENRYTVEYSKGSEHSPKVEWPLAEESRRCDTCLYMRL